MPSLASGVSSQSKFTTVAIQTIVCVTDKGPLSRFHGGPLMLNLGVLWGFLARSDCWMQKEGVFARKIHTGNRMG